MPAGPVRQQAGLLAVPARPALNRGGGLRALVSIHYTAEQKARLFDKTKGLIIPKFGVLSFSSSTSTVYAVQVQATAVV